MRRIVVFLSMFVLCGTVFAQEQSLNIDVKERILANGLKVLVVERHEVPEVACRLFYNVGSANEVPGITGLSHLCEHMMFKGTKVIGTKDPEKDAEYNTKINELVLVIRELKKDEGKNADNLKKFQSELEEVRAAQKEIMIKDQIWQIYMQNGATGMNAFTGNDLTGYVVDVPSNKIELFFWMESDRMANAVFREFYSELDVVKEERRLRENSPTGFFYETFNAVMYDAHPYMWPVVGWMVDLDNMTLEKARKYHATYYVPNNAVLVLVGDVSAKKAFEMAEKYFGPIPRGCEPPPVVTAEPPQRYEKRIRAVIDTQPFVTIEYHVPEVGHPDIYALQVLDGVISGNSGRLYKEIVREQEIATSCRCGLRPSKFPGSFSFRGTPKGRHTPEEIEEAIYGIIESIKSDPIPDRDIKRAKKQIRARYIRMLTSNGYLSYMLATVAVMRDWREMLEAPAKLEKVSAKEIVEVAKKYLTPENRTVGIVTQPDKPSGPYLTVLVREMPRTPEAEAQMEGAKTFLSSQVPDIAIRMDEKNIYIEVGHFAIEEKEAANKRLQEVREYDMGGSKPFANAKLVTVGVEKDSDESDDR